MCGRGFLQIQQTKRRDQDEARGCKAIGTRQANTTRKRIQGGPVLGLGRGWLAGEILHMRCSSETSVQDKVGHGLTERRKKKPGIERWVETHIEADDGNEAAAIIGSVNCTKMWQGATFSILVSALSLAKYRDEEPRGDRNRTMG